MAETEEHDPLAGLEQRLQSHSRAFESLLALTPARDYFGSQSVDGLDPTEQWKRKKQTKEQKNAAKRAKLDPANQKSALDVMKEREAKALKRKRDDDDDLDQDDGAEVEAEQVGGGKRKKGELDADAAEARRREKAEKRKEKRQLKKEKSVAKKAKVEAKKARKQETDLAEAQAEKQQSEQVDDENEDEADDEDMLEPAADIEVMDVSGLGDDDIDVDAIAHLHANNQAEDIDADDARSDRSSAPTTPLIDSPAFDLATNHSAASSSSSIVPPSTADQSNETSSKKTKQVSAKPTLNTASAKPTSDLADPTSGIASPKIKFPEIDHEKLQDRLQKRIAELRVARKADSDEGKPAKSRQELLDQRRKKEEQRKATKKAQRQKAKEDEQRQREAQLRGSGSPLSADIFSPRSPQPPRENNYAFSRLAFEDGTTTDPSLSTLQDLRKKKGPQDPKTALQAVQKKQARLAGYDASKQAEIRDKDMWLNAKKRAHGERVRDDSSLLKKALKRKEKGKSKSEQEWKGREEAVVKGKEMKQKKREGNLAKRREEKGGGSQGKKGGGGGGKGKGGGKKKGRPGFEGRFKA